MQRTTGLNWRRLILLTIMGAGLAFSAVFAQVQLGQPTGKKEEQKKYYFEMSDVPWKKVVDWVADKMELSVSSPNLPQGTFNFRPPKGPDGKPMQYTLGEIVDIINDNLQKQNFTLLRSHASLVVWPASDKINPVVIPEVTKKELEQRGKTEIVSYIIKLENTLPSEIAVEAKKMLGAFGEVVPLDKTGVIWMSGRAGALRMALGFIEKTDSLGAAQNKTVKYVCQYILATVAEEHLKKLLGEGTETLTIKSGKDASQTFMKKLTVSVDEPNNAVVLYGAPEKVSKAEEILKSLDVKTSNGPIVAGPFLLKQYTIPGTNAVEASAALQEVYKKKSPNIIIKAVGTNTVMVWASVSDQIAIAAQLQGPEVQQSFSQTKLVPLATLDAATTSTLLKSMFPDPTKGGPFIDYQPDQNAIVIKSSPKMVEEVEAAIKVLAGGGLSATESNTRVITLGKGSASVLAEAIAEMLPKIRKNPVEVVIPGQGNSTLPLPKKELPTPPPPGGNGNPPYYPKPVAPSKSKGPGQAKGGSYYQISYYPEPQFVEPQGGKEEKKPQPNKNLPGDETKPITIKAFGNKLIVTSEDPKALAEVQQLITLLTKSEATEGDFEVIPLKNADAVEAANVLDEVFNGKKQNGGKSSGIGGFGGINPLSILQQMGGGGTKITGTPQAERIRVVADPATNSLIVKANFLDLLTIKRLLAKAIDSDVEALQQTYVLGPLQHADAVEMAEIIGDVYKQNMGGTTQQGSVGGFRGFTFFGGQGGGGSSNSQQSSTKKVTLAVGVDDRTNSLVIRSTKAIYDDVKNLVDTMEKLSADTTVSIKVVPIKGIDPQVIQQAVAAIQGSATSSKKPSSYSGPSYGGSPYGGYGSSRPSFGGSSFGGSPFGGYGSSRPSFGGSSFGGSPFGGSSFGGSPFGGSSFGGSPFGGFSRPSGFSGGGSKYGGGGSKGSSGKKGGRGPDFFEQPVMDDHSPAFYDPQAEVKVGDENNKHFGVVPAPGQHANKLPINLVNYQAKPQPPEGPAGVSKGGGPVQPEDEILKAPKAGAEVVVVPGLDILLIKAGSKAEIDEIMRLIEFIQREGSGSEIQIELVPLEHADPVSVTNILNQLFSRVNLGVSTTTSVAGKTPIGVGQPSIGQPSPFQPGAQPGLPGLPGFPGQPGQQPQIGIPQGGQVAQPAGSLVLIPIPRFHSILVAAYKSRMEDVKKEIARLDKMTVPSAQAVPFQLKKASATQVAQTLTTFYASRYPTESTAQNQIRITADPNSNTIWVQASPADMEEIRQLVWQLDNLVSAAVSELKIIRLKYAVAADLAFLVTRAISDGAAATGGGIGLPPVTGGPGTLPGLPGAFPGAPPGLAGQFGVGATPAATGVITKVSSLKFFATDPMTGEKRIVQSGVLQDVRINPDPRLNALIIAAPEKTMNLIQSLINDLDVPPTARADINIFTLKNVDAPTIGAQLQQLFLGTSAGAPGAIPGAAPGGVPGAFPGAAPGGLPGGGVRPPLQLTVPGLTVPVSPLIDLRITVDPRTNSLIVAGSQSDLDVIQTIISRLEDTPVTDRLSQVVRLKNALAADVATALLDFLNQKLNNLSISGQLTPFQILQQQVVLVPEPISNSLLISATPKYFDELIQLLIQLDRLPPQVMISALIAEVTFDDFNEFGVELGFQSPILFERSILPGGTLVNNAAAIPGFNFNNTGPLGQSNLAAPGRVGVQGLGNLGLGRFNSVAGVGGFVFSAASESVNILVRSLKTQRRLDVLSAPKVMTADNQAARVFVGQYFPYITDSTTTVTTGFPTVSNSIGYRDVGVQLQVTPKINPDGSVVMRVIPVVSSVSNTTVPITIGADGQPVFATAFDTQTVETTVIAQDGETVVLGGLVQRRNEKTEAKVPWLGDLPGVGALFRYRQQDKKKTELLIILTPHIVRCRADADRILWEEAQKIEWMLPDVLRQHGPHGMEPVMPGYVPPPVNFLNQPVPGSPYTAIPPVLPLPGVFPEPPLGIHPGHPGAELLPNPLTVPPQPGTLPQPGGPLVPPPLPPVDHKPVIHDQVPMIPYPSSAKPQGVTKPVQSQVPQGKNSAPLPQSSMLPSQNPSQPVHLQPASAVSQDAPQYGEPVRIGLQPQQAINPPPVPGSQTPAQLAGGYLTGSTVPDYAPASPK